MIDVLKFIEREKEKVAMLCRPKFIKAVQEGREKEYFQEISEEFKRDPLYEFIFREVEAWIK